MNNKSFRVQLINKVIADAADALIKNATIYDDVKTKLEEKGFDEDPAKFKPVYGNQIHVKGVKSGVSVTVPDNPIVNGKYNVFFQIRPGANATKTMVNTIIVQAEAGGMASAENTAAFGNKQWIQDQLTEIHKVLTSKFGNVSLGKLGIGSFSGGYDAVGKIISSTDKLGNMSGDPYVNIETEEGTIRKRFDSIVILDGIHEGKRGSPNPATMQKWVDVANMAKKDPSMKFVFVYTAVDPGSYASTSDSAYFITDKAGVKRAPLSQEDTRTFAGVKPASIASEGGFSAIQLYERKSDKAGYGYVYHQDNRPGSSGHQHIQAAKALPDVWNQYLAKDWNK